MRVPLANPHDMYIIYYMCVIARVIDVMWGPSMLKHNFTEFHKQSFMVKLISNISKDFHQTIFSQNTFLKTISHKYLITLVISTLVQTF